MNALVSTTAFSAVCALAATATAAPIGGLTMRDACHALDLRACTIQSLHLDAMDNGCLGLDLVFNGEVTSWTFREHSNRGAHYQVLLQQPGGGFEAVEPVPVNTWRGVDDREPGATAALAFEHDGFRVQFRTDDGSVWFAEPLQDKVRGAGANDYAVYRGADIISPMAECPVDETWRVFEHEGSVPPPFGMPRGTDPLLSADMAVDVDYDFYTDYGSSESAVENRVNAVINAVNNQYEAEVGVTHTLQAIVIRTSSADDPYGTNNIETLLTTLRNDWNSNNHPGIPRDIVHLFTGENTGSTIGLAYLGGLCSSYEYGVVQSNCCGSFGCATDLSAHEMGHNWSSGHCSCPSHTMNPSLTCANQFSSESEAQIISFRDANSGCLEVLDDWGACCYGTTCIERFLSDCEAAGGEFQGDGTDCADITCTSASGACCTKTGNCNQLSEAQCDVISGIFQGGGTNCADYDCTPPAIGACCVVTDCSVTTEDDCLGVWLGADTDCNGNPCTENGFVGLTHRVVGVNLVDTPGMDNWTVDIYAHTGPGERIDAVAGTPSQIKTVYSTHGFWQSAYGGATSQSINPAFYPVVPELRWDSRVTIGALDQSGDPFDFNGLGDVGIDFGNFENGGSLAANDGTWYVLPTDDQGSALAMQDNNCDSVDGVLVARLTMLDLNSSVTMEALFQGRNALGITFQASAQGTFSLGSYEDCNANGVRDTCDIANGDSNDANGNGVPDECENTCAWDLDGDGDTDVDDLLTVIAGWGSPYDVDDLLNVLADYGCEG